ncbi:MAG: hypothetical protein EOP62_02945 [Sphingomonadales bacterium]|nr:MAG: hypothetical protein EOP62_02945 [Sphingomonadales bacterium]
MSEPDTDLPAQLARQEGLGLSAQVLEAHLADLQGMPIYAWNDDGRIATEGRLLEIRRESQKSKPKFEDLRRGQL